MKIENFVMVIEDGTSLFYEGINCDGITWILN